MIKCTSYCHLYCTGACTADLGFVFLTVPLTAPNNIRIGSITATSATISWDKSLAIGYYDTKFPTRIMHYELVVTQDRVYTADAAKDYSDNEDKNQDALCDIDDEDRCLDGDEGHDNNDDDNEEDQHHDDNHQDVAIEGEDYPHLDYLHDYLDTLHDNDDGDEGDHVFKTGVPMAIWIKGNCRSYQLTGLSPSTKYSVKVAATSMASNGPFSLKETMQDPLQEDANSSMSCNGPFSAKVSFETLKN